MKSSPERAIVRQWLAEPLPRDVAQALDRLARTEDVRHMAVMPDVHLSREVCTGTVAATRRRLYPQAVGGDIGCGMAALRFAEAKKGDGHVFFIDIRSISVYSLMSMPRAE